MPSLIGAFVLAFAMYSALPMPKAVWEERYMRYALGFFPLVGLVVGGAVWGWLALAQTLNLARELTAAVAVVLPIALTGGIHLDGLCDTSDALGSHAEPARKLEILKDSHAGAFAVIGCGVYLLVMFGLWCQYAYRPRTAMLLLFGFLLSRSISGLSVLCLPRARADGYAASFADAAHRTERGMLVGWMLVAAAGMLVTSPLVGGLCLLMAGGFFLCYRGMALRQFGGVTGDLAGWFLQLCELMLLAIISIGGIWL